MWATLSVDGRIEFHEGVPALEELQEAVGGFVEIVDIPGVGLMWLNEDGKYPARDFRGNRRGPLPHNPMATRITTQQRAGLAPDDYIFGVAVFTGNADEDGETTGLSESSVSFLRQFVSE